MDDPKLIVRVSDIRYLEGNMLTLIEAMMSDPAQRKAAKDLTRQTLWDWANVKYETAATTKHGVTYTYTETTNQVPSVATSN